MSEPFFPKPADPIAGATLSEIAARLEATDRPTIPQQIEPLPPEHSEDALAVEFTRAYKNELRYVAQWNKWLVWNSGTWSQDRILSVYDRVRLICRAAAAQREVQDPRGAKKISSAQVVAAVERLARSDPHHAATTEQWDADPWLLNTPAGVVDLRTAKNRTARPADYMTRVTAVGPHGTCERWLAFLARITNNRVELQDYLQRLCGYALTGSTQEQVLSFFYGTGANGKSVFLNTVSGILGSYAHTAGMDTFTETRNERHPTDLASLQGARLVTAIETEDGRRWAESKIKSLTGGDPISARFMRQDFFTFQPRFKIIVSGNHKPGIRAVDEAMRRRLHLVPFTITIPHAERDPKLMEKLRLEWPGILAWMIQGCQAWQAEGLKPPRVVTDETAEYLAAEDTLGQWIHERCSPDKFSFTFSADLYADWRDWAEAANEYAGSQKRFSENLAARGFTPERNSNGRGFRGIRLKKSAMTDMTRDPYIDVTRARVRTNTDEASDASSEAETAGRLIV